jgi:RHS repeat-associated protein
MTAYPANEPRPTASAISYQAVVARSNNGILKLGDGALAFFANQPSGSAHLIVDITGYFTEGAGTLLAYHAYYPFGEEATAFSQDAEQMKFTGHERDLASAAGAGDDLDYMHARHNSPLTGRFVSLDPSLESVDPFSPQSWNRYNYVQNNPLLFVDPTGELLVFAGSAANLEKLRKMVNDSLHGQELVINQNGTAQLVANNVQGPASPEQAALAGALSAAINRSEVVRIGVESGTDVRAGSYFSEAIDIQDIGALGSGPAVSSASALAHEVVEQTAKQVFGLAYSEAHIFGTAEQGGVSGFARGRTNKDLLDQTTGNGYTLTEQTKGNQTVLVIIKWSNNNIVKVIRK